ncbi:hypothetical protein FOVSG1_008644 [Fusarium oxysporum f. sp. vasinfectum]
MMPGNPAVSLQTLSAADGFLAGLMCLSATKQATAQGRATDHFTHARQSWKCLEIIWINLESVQVRTLELVPRLGLRGIDNTLDSFISPILFFQAAALSLRNTLIGQPPSTLGNIVALFCLSHAVSRHLRCSHHPAISDTGLCIDQWGNAISKYGHRQAFTSLIRALFPEIMTPPLRSTFLDPVTADYSDSLPFMSIYQDAPFEPPPREGDLIGNALEHSDATPNLLSLSGSQPTDQEAHNDRYTFIWETGFPSDPHGSALVTNLTLFLEQCGDLFQILSGRWVTAKHQYSPSSALNWARPQSNDVSSYLQRMRQDGSFQDPSSMGILSIVDTFIQLGYLRTPEDVQEYMIIVGKVQRRKVEDNSECPWGGFTLWLPRPLNAIHSRTRAKEIFLLRPHSDVSKEVKNFARALRRHESFEEPSARGILAIVDRFVGLDYFPSIQEIRDYITIVAKKILPSGKPFVEVCKSVYLSTGITKMRPVGRRQDADRALHREVFRKRYPVTIAEKSSQGRPI